MAYNRRTFPVLARAAVAALSLLLVAVLVTAAGAISKHEVEDAFAKVEQLKHEIADQQAELARIGSRLADVTEERLREQDVLDDITDDLIALRLELRDTRQRFNEIEQQLYDRAREAFISGPGSNLGFVLGATTLSDLSDRLEFMDAVAESDAELAAQVDSAKNQLAADEARAQELQAEQQKHVDRIAELEAELQASFDAQDDLVASIEKKKAEALETAKKLNRKYQKQLAALFGGFRKGLFKICPVDQPRGFGDGFGAPRFAGGYHLHEGVDIVAPEGTIIRAPFDGVARSSTNTLGGDAVYVVGSHGEGEVYNAHLSAWSENSNGPVSAGDVIGYVGWTGDAYGGVYHDHFEYHPVHLPDPDEWPKSAYGYSVIDNSINPYPLLVDACL